MEQKSCINCGSSLASYYKIGDTCPHCKARFVGEKKPPPRWDQVPLTGAKKVVVTVLAILFAIGMIIYQIKKRT